MRRCVFTERTEASLRERARPGNIFRFLPRARAQSNNISWSASAHAHPTTFPGTHARTQRTRARVQFRAPHVSTPRPPPPCSSLVGGNLFLLIKTERVVVRSVALRGAVRSNALRGAVRSNAMRAAVRSNAMRSVALRAALHVPAPLIHVETRVTLIVEK